MLTNLNIEEVNSGLLKKDFSYKELISAYFDRFKQNSFLNVHISEYWDCALKKAELLDNSFSETRHMLQGIPISVKDMFLVKGTKTTAASKVLENFVAPYESFVTSKLEAAGYIMPFKNNLDEFAMGSSSRTSYYGAVINPWVLSDGVLRVPGGSSGGSSAAVAAGMSLASLGTDTGGSVRQPAAFCGIIGFKPTYGRCSRRGVIAFASSLDHPGIFSRTVQDACHVFETIAGYDSGENTSLNVPVPKLSRVSGDVKGKIIGVQRDLFDKLVLPEYKQQCLSVIKELEIHGAIIKEIELPSLDLALKLYYIIAPAEAASNLARYDGFRYGHKNGETFEQVLLNSRSLFGQEVTRRVLIGSFVLSAEEYDLFLGKALRLRTEIRQQMACIFDGIDAFLLPTTPGAAFALDDYSRCSVEMYYEDLFTILANVYGGPAMQVPIGTIKDPTYKEGVIVKNLKAQKGLPVGIQVLADCEREDIVVSISKKIEEIVAFGGME